MGGKQAWQKWYHKIEYTRHRGKVKCGNFS